MPLVIEMVFASGEKEVITIPAKSQYAVIEMWVSGSENEYTITKLKGWKIVTIKEVAVSLATGERLYSYPGSRRDVMTALFAGGLGGPVYFMVTPHGIFPIPKEMLKDWEERIPEIEEFSLPYVRGQQSKGP